MMRVY